MGLFKYYHKLDLLPIPYEWCIGLGFYYYIKSQFSSLHKKFELKKEVYLWIPAILFTLLKTYLFLVAIAFNDYSLTSILITAGFFKLYGFLYLFFNLVMGLISLQIIRKQEKTNFAFKHKKNIRFLSIITYVFVLTSSLSIGMHSLDFILHAGTGTWSFYYPILIMNAVFIYWIGYVGFTQFKSFFNFFEPTNTSNSTEENPIINALLTLIKEEEIYKDPKMSLAQTAILLKVSPKKLSEQINEQLKMNFSEFLNVHRVEKVKTLLTSIETEKYTLLALAEIAGFRTKSSFNTTFKRLTGKTPSEYRRLQKTS
ncbi:helix-turn-helix domain-containing protein [uncultured Kordia sp.]|uniref:helix-turn-helix domain-containing protein n=1 Tax=uncultured Kordia sp. TaxID=507699 RepID=UPI002609AC06|nr:helix-turn-helix domain-containing protein [uncultured Kordia sp.]